jgi:hypothetical protein
MLRFFDYEDEDDDEDDLIKLDPKFTQFVS